MRVQFFAQFVHISPSLERQILSDDLVHCSACLLLLLNLIWSAIARAAIRKACASILLSRHRPRPRWASTLAARTSVITPSSMVMPGLGTNLRTFLALTFPCRSL